MIPGYESFCKNNTPAMVARVARVRGNARITGKNTEFTVKNDNSIGFDGFDTPAMPARVARVGANPSNHSNPSSTPKNKIDAYLIIERAAIMEYDGEMPRDEAEAKAALEVDQARPMGTDNDVLAWRAAIAAWKPAGDDDLPQPPPRTTDGALWAEWWARIEAHYKGIDV